MKMVSETLNPVEVHTDITIMPTTPEHVRELTDTIRDNDRREIEAYGFSCAKGLWRSYKRSLMTKTAIIDGKVAAIWGCGGTYLGTIGSPWLITSNEIKKISPLKFARMYQREVYGMLEIFPKLVNFVLADYHEAIRLLMIVGFEVGEPEKQGKGEYRKFTMDRRE